MPTTVHEFAWPDRVVIGTIGVPGERTFYLQVRAGKQIVSIALEKQQSAQLAEKIDEILDQLVTLEGNPFSVPTSTPIELVDNDQLETVEEQFRTGAMSLGWDPATAQARMDNILSAFYGDGERLPHPTLATARETMRSGHDSSSWAESSSGIRTSCACASRTGRTA